ncbi:MAG: hypothetical protein KAJ91_04035 [Candidatus Aenigmarchaeota archaeon]|nr:hypothetical protein [Candidatus Aenigmarchaeota archaeon]
MDDSAAEKIRLTEKEAAENIIHEKARLEKDFNDYTKKSEAVFEKFSKELLSQTESKKTRAIKDAEKEILAIRNKRKKDIVRLEHSAKKNLDKTVRAFVRIAGKWRTTP